MNVVVVNDNQIEQIVQFMYEQNNCSKHHIGYCGKNKDEIKSSVIELIEDNNKFFMTCDEDKLNGVMGYEKYDNNVEIWGPFLRDKNVQALDMLWDNMMNSINDSKCKYYIHCNSENEIAKEFALDKGFKFICQGKTMSLSLKDLDIPIHDNISTIIKSDYDVFSSLHDITFPNTNYNGKQIINMLDDEHELFVVKENSKLVGYIFISMDLEFNEGDIEYIGVDLSCRGKGYGKQLIYEALRCLREKGITELQLWVNTQNKYAISLYTKVGFNIVDKLMSYAYSQN
ncbi:GNAT family N-acetyltransferase [Sedimentibacter sp. zth1]|uniref:GNAT family N-acetyltransferase n=1 Tax=Sedimentibacter sp. zth1 TaxID=2816908 RepID=UPI001A927BB8|nr:GNAT family N-acetyltransferase [Sedimentibacter sp. zth1]QSX05113.1 GNAT family N-acetyltransferase [Sedimentibacter sp. zth1]